MDMLRGVEADRSPAWRAGRGPLRLLPAPLFEDRRAWLAILTGWVVALGGSVLIGFVLTHLAPGGAGPELGAAPPLVLWALANESRNRCQRQPALRAAARNALLHAARIDRIIKGVAQGDLWDEFLQLALRLTQTRTA